MIINVIDNEDRLDKYLLDKIEVSRSKLQKMIENGNVLVNGNKVKNSYVVKIDDEITIDENYQEKIDILPENIPIDIVFEDVFHPQIKIAVLFHFLTVNGKEKR